MSDPMSGARHYPSWIREEMMRDEHNKRVAELEAEVDRLRAVEAEAIAALAKLVDAFDAEARVFGATDEALREARSLLDGRTER